MSKKRSNGKTHRSGNARTKSGKKLDVPAPDLLALEGLMRHLVSGIDDLDSDVEAAQQIMYQAFEARSPRRQQALAHKAIEISRDCADAYVLLAEYATTRAQQLKLYEEGVAAGERALGKDGFDEYAGHFWGFLPTRPYMRAREGLVNCLWEEGRREEAIDHCFEMLRLNPNDNQGVRYRLLAMLFDLARLDDVERLLEEYKDDGSAEWAYTRALLAFCREGDSSSARKALSAAKKINAHVPLYLARVKSMPREAPQYITFGGVDEAVDYAAQFLPAWKDTPGATSWLRKTLKLAPAAVPSSKRQPWSKVRLALGRLPQHDDEAWELDLRQFAVLQDNEAISKWMVVALNTHADQVVHFDVFDSRPKDAEVWSFLTTAMLEPQDDAPHRPVAIRISRKSWFRSLRPKLEAINVECQLHESLEQIDRWSQTALPQLEKAQVATNAVCPTAADWSKLALLPQRSEEVWQAVVERLPVWLPSDGEPKRPWVCLVADVHSEAILATGIDADESPDDLLLKALWQASSSPAVGEAHLPRSIQVASDREREIVAPHLKPLGVQCVASSDLPNVRRLIGELADHLGGPQRRQPLIHSPGVTLAQVGDLFEAASDFYRARPWREISGDKVIRVACKRVSSGPWYAVVMGQAGIEQGIALYEDAQLLRTLLRGELSDEESGRRTSAISLTFGEQYEVDPQDLEAALEHGWAVAGPEAYPCILRVNPGMALRTPLKWELELLEGCLRAIPHFLTRNIGKAEIPVGISGNSCTFKLEQMEGG